MGNSSKEFSKFASSFNKNEEIRTASLQDIDHLESSLNIKLPEDFSIFIQHYGNLWTPNILDIIVDNDIEMNDIQQFMLPEEILEDKREGFTSQVDEDLIPFASDCMGNLYAFKTSDIEKEHSTAKVYFFDHDLDEVYFIANSFRAMIQGFNSLI